MNEELPSSEHEELLRLSLSTGSTHQPPPLPEPQPPLPKSPPHPSLLQIMPPSSSSLPLLHQSPHPPYDFPFPLFHQATCSLPETPPHSSTQPQSVEQNSLVPPTDFTQTPEATPSPPPEGQAGPSGTSSRVRKKCKETAIESPYPWAKPTRAKIFSREELLSRNITVIIGDVRCKGCKEKYKVEYDLLTKFSEISSFIDKKKDLMHSRAPKSGAILNSWTVSFVIIASVLNLF
ncbi:hypothetical protein K1719_032219 [Acacia pycnantha]|nr:hypothetical protein K1719_032219 [Acacia pycnantha]